MLLRLSFCYLSGYLLLTGVGFLLFPQGALKLLLAQGSYESAFVQLVGAFMMALGTLVVQILRHRLAMLHRTTVYIRLFFMAVISYLYATTRDPLFLVMLGVVALGVGLTATGLILQKSHQSSNQKENL